MHIILALVWALSGSKASAVIGGRASEDFPSVVKLRAGDKVCSGTIVGPRTVLSAAHCANVDSPYFEYAGERYSVRYVRSGSGDLSLAIADRDITGAKPMSIGGNVKHGEPIANAGYGCTEKGGKPGSMHIGFSKVIGMDEDHLLSVAKDGGALCDGDSGGPAIVRKDSKFYLVAVNSLSDVQHVNITVRMDSEESRRFLKQAAVDNRLEIPGL
jgi:hypothetical protein